MLLDISKKKIPCNLVKLRMLPCILKINDVLHIFQVRIIKHFLNHWQTFLGNINDSLHTFQAKIIIKAQNSIFGIDILKRNEALHLFQVKIMKNFLKLVAKLRMPSSSLKKPPCIYFDISSVECFRKSIQSWKFDMMKLRRLIMHLLSGRSSWKKIPRILSSESRRAVLSHTRVRYNAKKEPYKRALLRGTVRNVNSYKVWACPPCGHVPFFCGRRQSWREKTKWNKIKYKKRKKLIRFWENVCI